jgi:SprT-like family
LAAKKPSVRESESLGTERFRDFRDIAACRRYHAKMGINDELRDRVRRWFGEFDAQFFGGKLPEHEIRVERLTIGQTIYVKLRNGKYRPLRLDRNYGGLHIAEENLIYMGSQHATEKDTFIREILLHEMCHAEVCRKTSAPLSGDRHGPAFVAELDRLAVIGESWAIEQSEYFRTVPARQQDNFPLDAWRSARVGK